MEDYAEDAEEFNHVEDRETSSNQKMKNEAILDKETVEGEQVYQEVNINQEDSKDEDQEKFRSVKQEDKETSDMQFTDLIDTCEQQSYMTSVELNDVPAYADQPTVNVTARRKSLKRTVLSFKKHCSKFFKR